MIMKDGHATLISFGDFPSVLFEEKTVTPPSIEGGGAIDTTTMRNTTYRQNDPKSLKTLGNMTSTVAYDPKALTDAESMIQVNQLVTVTFPDGQQVAFWGWLDSFTPGENTEGEQPTAEITVIPSNHDTNDDEVGPAHTATSITAPANLATVGGDGTVDVSYDGVVGATSYYIYRSESEFTGYSRIAVTNSTSFVDNTVTHGTTYYYKVATLKDGVLSIASDADSITATVS